MNAGISIVICTYNGSKRLPDTLRHIARQQVTAGIPWEVIVVDNNSSDNSADLATKEWSKHNVPVPFTICYQPVQGLTHARHLGYLNARYEFIILCDDDNWLDKSYVETAYYIMMQHPKIGMLGGLGDLVFETPAPRWIKDYSLFAGGKQADQNGKVDSNLLYGAGAILRKKAYDEILKGGFVSLLTDRMAALLTSGGDYELCYALALAGFDIWYDDRLRFQHFISKERLTWDYYIRYIEESSKCFEVLEPYKILLKTRKADMLSFNSKLVKSYLYHFKLLFPVLFDKITTATNYEARRTTRLKYISLLTRLSSYRHFRQMQRNYSTAIQLRQQLEERNGHHQAKKTGRQDFRLGKFKPGP